MIELVQALQIIITVVIFAVWIAANFKLIIGEYQEYF